MFEHEILGDKIPISTPVSSIPDQLDAAFLTVPENTFSERQHLPIQTIPSIRALKVSVLKATVVALKRVLPVIPILWSLSSSEQTLS